MTCPDENALVLLADGMLADPRRVSLEQHLDGCASCSRLVAELAGMAAPMRPVPPRYKVIRQLGAGAMGVVWEAEDRNLARRVALKFVRTDAHVPERRRRLVREARALAQLRHPNVVSVYDVGASEAELFLALELVIGMDARTWRAAQPRSLDEILAVWRQVAAGLAAVHHAGLVHRDIKPDNILVADDGRVLVGDFGLAVDRETALAGAIVGTPIYMAYEQLLGEPASRASDQFALCVSIWEALTGERPFQGTLAEIAAAMQARPTIPAAHVHIFSVLARGLDASPARRWPSIDALLDALAVRPARARLHPALLATAVAATTATITVGVLAWHDQPVPAASAPSSSLLELARTRLDTGDAAGCLRLLAKAPPDLEVDDLRARCTMKRGDCERGRAMLEASARARGWDRASIDGTVHEADFTYCPLDVGPRSEATARVRHRIGVASTKRPSCEHIFAFMAAANIELAPGDAMLEASCYVLDEDCDGGRAARRRGMSHGATADAMLAHPRCR